MRPSGEAVGTADHLAHDALVYDTDDRFVEVLAPFLAEGLAAGEEACVVTRSTNAARLREALGGAAERVRFIDAVDWYRHPARTIAGYHRAIKAAVATGAPRIRVVGEVEFGDTEIEHAAWMRYESVLNAVFATEPAWIICPYDARRLPATIVESALRTHSYATVGSDRRAHSATYVEPDRFVSALPLDMRGDVVAETELTTDLHPVRALGRRLAERVGLPAERTPDLVLLLNELATNAVVHGRPPARLRACLDREALTIEVTDGGRAPFDALAGFRPPTGEGIGGAGLWICRQLADRLEITTEPHGTTVRLRITLSPAPAEPPTAHAH